MKIIINKTDKIGDAIIAIPMAKLLKKIKPTAEIIYLGRGATKAIINASEVFDGFIDWNDYDHASIEKASAAIESDAIVHVLPNRQIADYAKIAKISLRIGTNRRLFHWKTCNRLINLTRKQSWLHEGQLNCKLLKPLGLKRIINLGELQLLTTLKPQAPLPDDIAPFFETPKFKLIIHPGSAFSAPEWPIDYYKKLLEKINHQNNIQVFFTGSPKEAERFEGLIKNFPNAHNLMGRVNLAELITVCDSADGLLACATGPLHIAAGVGIHALGLYNPPHNRRPRRWGPLGPKAETLVAPIPDCRQTKSCIQQQCPCIQKIYVEHVLQKINAWVQ